MTKIPEFFGGKFDEKLVCISTQGRSRTVHRPLWNYWNSKANSLIFAIRHLGLQSKDKHDSTSELKISFPNIRVKQLGNTLVHPTYMQVVLEQIVLKHIQVNNT